MDNTYKFTLRNDVTEIDGLPIGRFDAIFTETDKVGTTVEQKLIPPYVKIDDDIFKTKYIKKGNESIFISPGIKDPIPKNSEIIITYTSATQRQFLIYKIKKDKSQKWMFWALIAAIIGVFIDSSFAIGKIHTFIPCPEWLVTGLLGLAMSLKILGLWLAFKKGFWESK